MILQILLLVNVFIMGAVTTIAVQHLYAHFKPHKEEPKPPLPLADPVHLPDDVKESLIHEAEANFLAVINGSIGELEHDLKATAGNLNKQLETLGSQVTVSENARYSATLEAIRQQTEAVLQAAQAEIATHQQELRAKLAEEETTLKTKLGESVAAEQQRLLQLIDTRLADAVTSFLLDTLQHNVDLGAQTAYLTAQLEEHKDEFKREVADGEAPAAK